MPIGLHASEQCTICSKQGRTNRCRVILRIVEDNSLFYLRVSLLISYLLGARYYTMGIWENFLENPRYNYLVT